MLWCAAGVNNWSSRECDKCVQRNTGGDASGVSDKQQRVCHLCSTIAWLHSFSTVLKLYVLAV